MRLRLVTVAILLAVASRADGRPRHPEPLDSGSRQEANVGSPDSRYMMTLTSSPTSSRRRDISITSLKYDSGSNRSKWLGRSVLPGLSLDNARKNYLPLGALSSSAASRSADGSGRPANHQSAARALSNRSPAMIPFIPSPRLSTPAPIPVSMATQRSRVAVLKSIPREHALSLPIPIPVSIPATTSQTPRAERKIASRNLVKIIPQRLRPNNYVRRNLTRRPVVDLPSEPVVDLSLKNWPNDVVQNVEDLFNYEKYTSFYDGQNDDNNKISTEIIKLPNNREPSIKSPGTQKIQWSKIPVVEVTSSTIEDLKVHASQNIDNLLGDLGKKKINAQQQIAQNTIVHIMNAGSRKPNVTVVEPMAAPNRTKPASTRPPQNVHIMFMTDKDGNQTSGKPVKPVEIGGDSDCPTIMINSITQINNTIESKEGCTDLNIVINSHVLNTQVFTPSSAGQNVQSGSASSGVKDPYGQASDSPTNNYQTNPPPSTFNPNPSYNQNNNYNPSNNYNPNNNYNTNGYGEADKNPGNQPLSDTGSSQFAQQGPQIQTFELFQNTHINVGGGGFQSDVPNDVEDAGSAGADDSAGTDVDGSPLTDPTEGSTDMTGTQGAEDPAASGPGDTGGAASSETQGLSDTAAVAGDVGSPQANDAPGAISLPSLPNIPNLPNPSQVSNLASNVAGTGGGGGADDEDDFDLLEAISPVNLLDSITSVFDSFSGLNPVNYGILGMAVAPFVAFAAGIMGVAAFVFPWAFPGTLDLGRSWADSNTHVRVRVNPMIRDVVHSSIHEYKHLNEWKGRRRKRKRKR